MVTALVRDEQAMNTARVSFPDVFFMVAVSPADVRQNQKKSGDE
jgi:hypothetical protein